MNYLAIPRLLSVVVLSLASGAALAQYIWIDEKGGKNVSDRPPPASVPAKNILKSPGGKLPPAEAPAAAPAPAADAPASGWAEREADYKKRTAEKAEADKKQADLARQQAEKKRACDSARVYQAQAATGMRYMQVGRDGSRSVLTEEERNRNLAKARQVLGQCK